jgi:hypothetical protein
MDAMPDEAAVASAPDGRPDSVQPTSTIVTVATTEIAIASSRSGRRRIM